MIKLKKNAIVLFAGDSITDGGRSKNVNLINILKSAIPNTFCGMVFTRQLPVMV